MKQKFYLTMSDCDMNSDKCSENLTDPSLSHSLSLSQYLSLAADPSERKEHASEGREAWRENGKGDERTNVVL